MMKTEVRVLQSQEPKNEVGLLEAGKDKEMHFRFEPPEGTQPC